MSRKIALLKALLIAVAITAYEGAPLAADAPKSGGQDQAKGDSIERGATRTLVGAGTDRSHDAPLYELRSRHADGRDYKGPLIQRVLHRKGLAVIADFSNARLEDWQGSGIRSVAQLKDQLRRMEEHWTWLSRGFESFHWDIIRITLPVELRPDAYPGWVEYREAVATLVRQEVNVSEYDANYDGVIDTVWVIASDNGCIECAFILGGSSQNAGANIFVDGQDSLSIVVGATGNFNHETAHTIGVPDLYGSVRHHLLPERHGGQLARSAE